MVHVLVRKRETGGPPPPVSPPVNTVAPAVTGTAMVGQTLSTTDGTWTGDPVIAFTYQWQRNGVNIGGATANTYLLVTADLGKTVRARVTGTNGAGSATATSNSTAAVTSTFGMTTVGPNAISNSTDYLIASPFTLVDSGVSAVSMSVYFGGTAVGAVCRLAIYSPLFGQPRDLVAVTPQIACNPAGVPQWFTAPFSAPVPLSPGVYYLTFWCGVTAPDRYSAGIPEMFYKADTYSSVANPTDPFAADGSVAELISIYATYT